ncbi:MAG: TylF/MycF/NovP-related O-methyltransferase [Pseudomonadota bacterium]|nr:TylF/MycF/NovP-related O-methyltransferase [Pseudomonadota bacterium]
MDAVDVVQDFAAAETIFVYACDSDAIGLPYIRQVASSGGSFDPGQAYAPASYSNVDEIARRTIEAEYGRQRGEEFSKFDFGAGDSLNLTQAIAATVRMDGSYVEVGCFNGSSACVALAYMRERAMLRDCYFLDCFSGFTYEAARNSADFMWSDTHASNGIDKMRQCIEASAGPSFGLCAYVEQLNIITDELPALIGTIAVANIDADLYEAVLAALQKVSAHICVGGIIVVEDAGHTPALIGSRLALEEFLATPQASAFVPVYLESGQTFLVNTGVAPLATRTFGSGA